MRHSKQVEISNLGKGFWRLWSELQIWRGEPLSGNRLASLATESCNAPVQPQAPMSIILGRERHSAPSLARLCHFFGVENVGEVERIGEGDFELLTSIVQTWGAE